MIKELSARGPMINALVNHRDIQLKMQEYARIDKDNPNPDKRGT